MNINILSKAPKLASYEQLHDALTIEAAIINHCRANISPWMDLERSKRLRAIEQTATDRYDILMEMMV